MIYVQKDYSNIISWLLIKQKKWRKKPFTITLKRKKIGKDKLNQRNTKVTLLKQNKKLKEI